MRIAALNQINPTARATATATAARATATDTATPTATPTDPAPANSQTMNSMMVCKDKLNCLGEPTYLPQN